MATVLVVEDERDIRELLRRFLERSGCSVLTTGSGTEALHLLATSHIDLVLLDLGLPDVDGTEVLREASPTIPVIILTARSDTQDRISGLKLGADDYVVKPFSPTEVVLRVKAVLARTLGRALEGTTRSYGGGQLTIDPRRHHATCQDRDLNLTVSEWELLHALTDAPGRAHTRLELINRVRGYEFEGYERTIDSHVKNLRHKLSDDDHLIVRTVVGVGYRFGLAIDG
ncbi:MAG TPA: response regulator transcription factor [Motilibacterales bacterium]|nr:response regulator transcription factor [Motilibacterales bacterium]